MISLDIGTMHFSLPLVMLHQHWLLFCGVWFMDIVDATQPITITVKLPPTSDLGKCQTCLTDIAGVNRLSFAPSFVHNSNRPRDRVKFQASGCSSSFLRARVDCQNDVACGSMTITGSEPINTAVSLLDSLHVDEHGLKRLCVLTDSTESFDCGSCLKMTSGSPSIQKFYLVTNKEQRRYLHVLYTRQWKVFKPCKLSGICTGPNREFGGDLCDSLVRKLIKVRFIPPIYDTVVKPNASAVQDGFLDTTKWIYESVKWPPLCYQTSAPHDLRTNCLGCIARESSGMVVLFDHSTIEHASDGQEAEKSEQYIFVISKRGPNFSEQCKQLCRLIIAERKSKCITASDRSVDTSNPKGTIYYNMEMELSRRNQLIQAISNKPKISNCMRVEHNMEDRELCQSCVEKKAGYASGRLSHIDLLISMEMHLQPLSVSSCISHGSESTRKLCKKIINVPDEFCFYSGLPRLGLRGRNGLLAPSKKHPVSLVLYEKASVDCYTCLTSRLDVLIIDRFVTLNFWMVGVPQEYECLAECGYLAMVLKEDLDISLLRTISSNSVADRDHLTEKKRSRSFAANDRNDRSDGSSSEGQRSKNSNIESKQSQGKDEDQDAQKDGGKQNGREYWHFYEKKLLNANMLE